MRILYTTGRELSYPRNAMILSLLKAKHQVRYFGRQTGKRSILVQSILNSLYISPVFLSKKYELCVVGFYGNILMLWAGMFSRQPILFDAFVSTFDTLCLDRQIIKPQSLPGTMTKWIDQVACKKASRIIVDTWESAKFFHEVLGIPLENMDVLFVGCDENIFSPLPTLPSDENIVLFYGSLLPLHGVNVILEAAQLLRESPVRFQLIGPFLESGKRYPNAIGEKNIDIIPPVPITHLPRYIASATICLGGHFGPGPKAQRVIAGKTFQCIAMGKPTIVGDNAANRELLSHGVDAWFCKMDDPQALAEAIGHLIAHPKERLFLGENARRTFLEKASTPVLNKQLEDIIAKTITKAG